MDGKLPQEMYKVARKYLTLCKFVPAEVIHGTNPRVRIGVGSLRCFEK